MNYREAKSLLASVENHPERFTQAQRKHILRLFKEFGYDNLAHQLKRFIR